MIIRKGLSIMEAHWWARMVVTLMAIHCSLMAAPAQADEVEQLTAQMYKIYNSHDVEQFLDVTGRLKEASLRAGNERMFYKAWGNQALFLCNNQQRSRGYQTALDLQKYALEHNSKFGIFNGTHLTAYVLGQMRAVEDAKREFIKAINYAHEHLPGESAASSYLELAKLEYSSNAMEKAVEYAEKAKHEPNLNPLHLLNALSIQCLAVADSMDYRHKDYAEKFRQFYAERAKVKEAYGRDGINGLRVEMWKCLIDKDFDGAIAIVNKMPSRQSQLQCLRFVYRQMGDYKKAYETTGRYMKVHDSITESHNAHLLMEMNAAMGLGRVESEAKDLRLRNQQLRLDQVASELEQQRLEQETLTLSLEKQAVELRNRDIELQNAAVRQRNDSLDRNNKDLQLSEWESRMEAQKSEERTHHVFMAMLGIIAAIVIAALGFILWRRSKHTREIETAYGQLEDAHTRLEDAYSQLETTTKAKERIESELRIARGIQMGMVPRHFDFPGGVDIYASLESAKEVGGDLYDLFLQGGRLYFCIGDVAGKGIPAALFMSVAVNMFRMVAKEGFPPAYIATRLNDALSQDNENGMFVTMFIGEIDLSTGHMDFCNAGHNPPVIIDRPLSPHEPCRPGFIEMEPNAPIGLWPQLEFVGESIDSLRGRTLFLYTDGLSEAENLSQDQFGDDRLIRLFKTRPYDSSRQTVDMVKAAVSAFVGEAEPSDDLTMLCIKI